MPQATTNSSNRICKDESIVSILSQIDERFKVIEYLLSNRIGNLSIGTLRAIAENTGMTVSRAGFFLRLLEDRNLISRHRNGVFKLSNQLLALEILGECSLVNSTLVAHPYVMVYRCKYDPDWTLEFVSDGCIAITGYTPDCLLQNRVISFSQIVAPEYKDCFTEWERMIKKGLPFHSEYEIKTASGQRRWVLDIGHAIQNEFGEVHAIEGVVIDISDWKNK